MIIDLQDYAIHIGNLNQPLLDYFKANQITQTFVLVDENTKEHCLPLLDFEGMPDYQLIEIKSGELNKNINTCREIWDKLIIADADRKALVLNLGGGVIGDMGGFCSATYKRGIRFIQIIKLILNEIACFRFGISCS